MVRTGELIWSSVGQENIMNNSNDKDMAIESAINQTERKFGKGSIMKLGTREIADIPVISTGCLALDSVLGIGVLQNIIEKSGSWYSYNGDRIGQGREAVKEFLKENTYIYKDLFINVIQALGVRIQIV
jgi:recombination protein RecA